MREDSVMELIKDINSMEDCCREKKLKGKKIGFVPTMGALHKGHLSLIQKARDDCDFLVVSIFVNPTQFGPGEDFEEYPRDLSKDTKLCQRQGVDVIFIPLKNKMYPKGFSTWIQVEGKLTSSLEASSRSGHFRGVATIVAKLFNIILPDYSYFGEKDYQQALVLKKMVKELNIDTQIILMPTIREKDGLACSSRNNRLTFEERKAAQVLHESLMLAKREIQNGKDDPSSIISSMVNLIRGKDFAKVDYIAVVNPENLEAVKKIKGKVLIVLAVHIGKIRLIDNMTV